MFRIHRFSVFSASVAGVALAGGLGVASTVALAQHAQRTPAATQAAADAPLQVRNPWVRATVAGQMATGAFMELHASAPLELVGVRSALTPVAEVHEMAMVDGVMKMRAVAALPLAAHQGTLLKPGGYHIMLMDLKKPVAAGSTVPLTLLLKDAKGRMLEQHVEVPVRAAAPGMGKADAHAGHM